MEAPLHKNEPSGYQIPEEFSSKVGHVSKVLSPFLTDERKGAFEKVLAERSRYVSVCLESTRHCHNISAVLRTADAFGVQDVTFMYHEKLQQGFRQKDSVERGTSNWLTLRRGKSIESCVRAIKNSGRNLFLVALPSFEDSGKNFNRNAKSFLLDEKLTKQNWQTIFSKPLTIVLGNEGLGLSPEWHEHADGYFQVPMRGFVESLNLSVTAGIVLHTLQTKLLEIGQREKFQLSAQDKQVLRDVWTLRSCSQSEAIVERESPQTLAYLRHLSSGRFFYVD